MKRIMKYIYKHFQEYIMLFYIRVYSSLFEKFRCVQFRESAKNNVNISYTFKCMKHKVKNQILPDYLKNATSNRRRIAASSTHGILVAPSTKIPSISFPTPCI